MNNENKRTIGIIAGIVFLVVSLLVGMVLVQQRQVTQKEAEEIELESQFIECTWTAEGNYLISLEDEAGNTVAGPVNIPQGTRHIFEVDPRDLPDPVFCVIEDPDATDLSCKENRSQVEGCAPPTPTATMTPPPELPEMCEPCQEDEVLPRCADGFVCVHYPDGSKFCEDPEGPPNQCGPSPTVTVTLTPTATPTLTLTPTATPTTPPGEPTGTPAPTNTPEPIVTIAPTSSPTPSPTPTSCPIPNAVENIALSCSETPGRCSWDASEGADYYLVTIKDKNTDAPIEGYNPNKKVTETEATFEPVSGHSYECVVEAVSESCGGSSASISDACSFTAPTGTPEPTEEPTPTDVLIAEASETPAPTATEGPTTEPTLPTAGIANTTIVIALTFALIGFAALLVGLAL